MTTDSQPRADWGRIKRRLWADRWLYIMMIPGLVVVFVFAYMPMYGVQIAFRNFTLRGGITGSEWVGLAHFRRLIEHPVARQSIVNTIIISFNQLVWQFPAPIILALLLNELRHRRFKRGVQSILYLPHFISWVVISGLLMGFFSMTSGMVNVCLMEIGRDPINFLSNPDTFRRLLYLTAIWRGAGWGTIIYMAAIAGIDPQLYEAADMDGAGRFRRMWSITLPSMSFTIVTLFILNVGGIMSSNFDQIMNLIHGPTWGVGQTIDIFVFEQGVNQMNYSFTTAVGLFQQVINFALLLIANRTAKFMGGEGFL